MAVLLLGMLVLSPAGREPQAIATGWLPAHAESGQPTVRFFSRGC